MNTSLRTTIQGKKQWQSIILCSPDNVTTVGDKCKTVFSAAGSKAKDQIFLTGWRQTVRCGKYVRLAK